MAERQAMIDLAHALPLTWQEAAWGVSRGRVHSDPRMVSDADLALLRRLNALDREFPDAGARLLRRLLYRGGVTVGLLARQHLRGAPPALD